MPVDRPPRGLIAATLLPLALASIAACRPALPEPPDPDEPTPALGCDDAIPAFTLSRVLADSSLEQPPWLQVCAPCPAASGSLRVHDVTGVELPSASFWGPGRSCIVAMPTLPLPAVPSLPSEALLLDARGRGASLTFDLAVAGGRGADPAGLSTASFILPLDASAHRLPGGAAMLPNLPEAILLTVGAPASDGRRPLTLGGATDIDTQDECVPTTELTTPATLVTRQLAAPFLLDDPLPGGLFAERGSVQARLAPDGSALLDVVIVGLASLSASEPVLGLPPEEACSALAALVGFNPCVPCGDPALGVQGLPACVPFVFEVARAERALFEPTAIAPDDIPIDCRTPGDDDSAEP
mgnify:CR=1 FL=1